MTAGYALNIERLYGPGIVRVAAKHLLRELAAELGADSHIDAARIADNFILRGPSSAKEVAALAKSLMEAAGVTKCRKGAVTALELLFTLPATTKINPRQYFEQATAWAEQHFGVPVLSCVAHADEGSPHAHALLLPLVDGHMVGSDLHGGKAKLAAMQTSFHEAVCAPHGLPKYVPHKRLSTSVRATAMALAREKLQANAALTDAIIDALLVPHAKDPGPLLLALGIAMPTPAAKVKDFVSIMTSVCKPEPRSPIGKGNRSPIGKPTQAAPSSSLPDTCVGKGNPTPQNRAHVQLLPPAVDITVNTPAVDQRQPVAAEIEVRAERKCGEMLRDSAERGERATRGNPQMSNDTTFTPTLSDIGITRDQSSRYQQLAAMPGEYAEIAVDQQPAIVAASPFTAGGRSPTNRAPENLGPPYLADHAAAGADDETWSDSKSEQSAISDATIAGCGLAPATLSVRTKSTSGAPATSKSEPGKPRFDAGTLQTAETLRPSELAPACVPSGQSAEIPAHCSSPSGRANTGNSRNYGTDNQPNEIRHRALRRPGEPSIGNGDRRQADSDDYQRQRDDDRPAEHWNADTGEFVSTTSAPTRPPGRHGRAPYSARASPLEIIPELLALAIITEPKTPVRAESEHEHQNH